jgi:hypothetical protein
MKYIVILLTIIFMHVSYAGNPTPPTDQPPCPPEELCQPCEPYPECAIWPEMTVGDALDIKMCANKDMMYVKHMVTAWGTEISACAIVPHRADDPPRDGTLKAYRAFCLRNGGKWVGNDINGYCVGI